MERYTRRVLSILTVVALVMIAAHLAVMLWARHELTQNESAVAIHATRLALGEGLYHRLGSYPYTVSPYPPLYYVLEAALHKLRLPILMAGRLISFLAFLGVLVLCYRILALSTGGRWATWAGTLLAASTANLSFWATVGQVDMLGVFFSLAALHNYLQYRATHKLRLLVWSALFVVLAVFTKQTMVAAAATILLSLAMEERRRGVWFAASAGAIIATLSLGVNHLTGGGFFENTVFANINPFVGAKFVGQARYLILAGAGLWVLALAGVRRALREKIQPLYVYLAACVAILLVTGPKVGSDLNYQLETLIALSLCAGWSLERLRFFPELFRASRATVTLLQAPLLFHVVFNVAISGKILVGRLMDEPFRRQEYSQLRPLMESASGRIISVQLDPLLQAGRRIEVEPLIYTLLVTAGRVDGEPVQRALLEKKFPLVVLYEDLFQPPVLAHDPELPSLPASHLRAIRENYKLLRHVPGPLLNGDYLYVPK